MVSLTTLATLTLPLISIVHADKVTLYSDAKCTTSISTKTFAANSCASTLPEFKSYKYTAVNPGEPVQRISAFTGAACDGTRTSCNPSHDVGVCYVVSAGSRSLASSGNACN